MNMINRSMLMVVVLCFFMLSVAWAGGLEDGTSAYRRDDYKTALPLLLPYAEQGNADAQFQVGDIYLQGVGIPKDLAIGLQWLQRAADKGNGGALWRLGFMYKNGIVVAKDQAQSDRLYAEAQAKLRAASEQRDAQAQFDLGGMYAHGEGVAKDDAIATSWFSKAAQNGHANAQFTLGSRYLKGFGAAKDEAQAKVWFRKAAEQEHARAMKILMEIDREQTVIWLKKVAEQGNAWAFNMLGDIEYKRTGDLIRVYIYETEMGIYVEDGKMPLDEHINKNKESMLSAVQYYLSAARLGDMSKSELALLIAAYIDDINSIRNLLDKKINIDARQVNSIGPTPLIIALAAGSDEAAHLLIERGADINKRWRSESPLMVAAAKGKTDIVRLLLDKGAYIEGCIFGSAVETPMEWAAANGSIDVMRELLKKGASADSRCNDNSSTALIDAAWHGRNESIEILLHNGANINKRFDGVSFCVTPLTSAVKGNKEDTVKLLLQKGARASWLLFEKDSGRVHFTNCEGTPSSDSDEIRGGIRTMLRHAGVKEVTGDAIRTMQQQAVKRQ